MPRLRRLCHAEAACVVAGVESFSGASDAVLRYAVKYGALHMPVSDFANLEEWIAVQVLVEIEDIEGG